MKRLEKEKKQWIYVVALTIVILSISMGITRKIIFNQEIEEKGFYYFALITFSILIFIIDYYIIKWIRRIITGDKFSRKFGKHFLIYFGIIILFLLIIWPGYWVWDEIWVIDAITNGMMYTWQSIITELFYIYAMLLIPSPVGITIMQAIVISLVVAFLHTKVEEKFHQKWYNVIIYILFLTPAILINNLYALRLQLYAYTLLLLFTNLIFDYWEKKEITKSKAIFMYFLSAIAILWRSEGIIFFIVIPILMAITYERLRKAYIIGAMILLNIVTYIGYGKAVPSDGRYQTIIFMNPLSVMLQEDLKGDSIQEDLEKIDKVMDIALIQENPSYTETPAYWNYQDTIFRESYEEHKKEFYKAYSNIILSNPMGFLKARIKTFLASSGMDKEYRELGAFTSYYISQTENKAIEGFLNKYQIMKPFNRELKTSVETTLLGNGKVSNSIIRPVFWNVIPILIVMFIIMIERVIHKDYMISLICLSLFAKTVVVFLTAPASYFMYYFPEYICGISMIVLAIYKRIEEMITSEKLRSINEGGKKWTE